MAVQLPARLTLDCADAALSALRAAATGPAMAIDASTLQVFDSAALAVLLHVKRQALAAGQAFSVQAVPPKLTQLAQLYGVAELLQLQPPQGEAQGVT